MEENSERPKPSKLRVPRSSRGAPTTNSLKTNDRAEDSGTVEGVRASALQGLMGPQCWANVGRRTPARFRIFRDRTTSGRGTCLHWWLLVDRTKPNQRPHYCMSWAEALFRAKLTMHVEGVVERCGTAAHDFGRRLMIAGGAR